MLQRASPFGVFCSSFMFGLMIVVLPTKLFISYGMEVTVWMVPSQRQAAESWRYAMVIRAHSFESWQLQLIEADASDEKSFKNRYIINHKKLAIS
jgi:hypothetical protein